MAAVLYEVLHDRFAEQQLFLDVMSLGAGVDWTEAVRRAINSYTLVLVLIGPYWNPVDSSGRPRLANPDDPVRRELERALEQRARVIPVLVGDAKPPLSADLPLSLRELASRQAFSVRTEYFRDDVQELIAILARYDEAAADLPWGAIKPIGAASSR